MEGKNQLELMEELVEEFAAYKDRKDAEYKQLTEQVHELKAKGGRLYIGPPGERTTQQIIAEAFTEKAAEIAALTKKGKIGYELVLKAAGVMTASANLTGNPASTYWAQPAVRARAINHFRDIFNVIPSATGTWKFFRNNLPAGEGSFGFQTTHGDLKAQLDYDLTEITITADYLAGFVVIAKQMLNDLPFMQNFVSNELVEDYLRKEDNVFWGQLYSAATGPASTTSSVTAERIIQTIALMRENDVDVNFIVTDNQTWAKILVTKPNDYSIPGGIAITPAGQIAIAGVQVITTPQRNLGANKFLLGDATKAALVQAEGLSVTMSEHDDQNFRKNLITVKAECRIAMGIFRPDHFAYGNAGTT